MQSTSTITPAAGNGEMESMSFSLWVQPEALAGASRQHPATAGGDAARRKIGILQIWALLVAGGGRVCGLEVGDEAV